MPSGISAPSCTPPFAALQAPRQRRDRLRLVATEEALATLDRAQRQFLGAMTVVPEAALSRHERAIVNQLFEPACDVFHERREVVLPHARMLRSGNALAASEQTVMLYFLRLGAPRARAEPAAQPFDEAGLIYERELPAEAWRRAPASIGAM